MSWKSKPLKLYSHSGLNNADTFNFFFSPVINLLNLPFSDDVLLMIKKKCEEAQRRPKQAERTSMIHLQ